MTATMQLDCIMAAPPLLTRGRAKAQAFGTGLESADQAESDTRDIGWRKAGDGGCKDGRPAVNGKFSLYAPSIRRSAPQDQTAGS